MNHASLFSGIGGFDLAAEWAGWTNIFNCDIEEFPRKVLKHHFPNAIQYADIKRTDFSVHFGTIDVLTGGFPCQPFSTAGKRLGKNDERHLWPEMFRAIREIQPRWVVGENVRGLLSWSDGLVLEEVYADLESEGYEVQAFVLPAAGVNAPHKRDRVWIVASNASHNRRGRWNSIRSEERRIRVVQGERAGSEVGGEVERRGGERSASNAHLQRGEERYIPTKPGEKIVADRSHYEDRTWENFPTQSPVCGGDDGIPKELDSITISKWRKESIKAYGNAIVPQIAFRIFQTINQMEETWE